MKMQCAYIKWLSYKKTDFYRIQVFHSLGIFSGVMHVLYGSIRWLLRVMHHVDGVLMIRWCGQPLRDVF